ncbi:hypothetical protein N7495_007605 [Penicillium taxi]|uniref:uncharacterized protein n=1 Tax=Penicillium taxi TaxID=168475 RepID=UPI0025451808|nr:uncharacterized protein N7495_007605 [Penicillium taxi]KAJ5887564.1 hypothetical protein N7495_007605 [Penicillium taxi]
MDKHEMRMPQNVPEISAQEDISLSLSSTEQMTSEPPGPSFLLIMKLILKGNRMPREAQEQVNLQGPRALEKPCILISHRSLDCCETLHDLVDIDNHKPGRESGSQSLNSLAMN